MSNVKLKSGRIIERPTVEEDEAINQGILSDLDSRELDDTFFARARSATDVLGSHVVGALEEKRSRSRPAGSVDERQKRG